MDSYRKKGERKEKDAHFKCILKGHRSPVLRFCLLDKKARELAASSFVHIAFHIIASDLSFSPSILAAVDSIEPFFGRKGENSRRQWRDTK